MDSFMSLLHQNFFWWVALCVVAAVLKNCRNDRREAHSVSKSIAHAIDLETECLQIRLDKGLIETEDIETFLRLVKTVDSVSDVRTLADRITSIRKEVRTGRKKVWEKRY